LQGSPVCPNTDQATPSVAMGRVRRSLIGNESVPIQLAQCWFLGLAISNAK